ncbi:LytR/AlgR family response regulator transcription factor [Anoxynatronum buryatiense]|uniref:Stage 0 sporulation protein A homolog n=1 Tax=Anoxynatronum buryatiense TaxID=489973 RepID=A0AA45WY36_9CLOT|nr:LytTR family DNA-binding domain-containing protein [Anoxynatronum buryatiense]SMP66797.1 two component transcriptional regulator, LytTR family [Anoxynatronum buryatiense]
MDQSFKIAVCDDDQMIRHQLDKAISKFSEKKLEPFESMTFSSGEELIHQLRRGNTFDLIFLDIDLVTVTGIYVGQFIRNELSDELTQIVYISGTEQYAMSLFEVRPMHFLIKPIKDDKVQEMIALAVQIKNQLIPVFEFQTNRNSIRIPVGEIIYFESHGRKVFLVTKSETYPFYGKLAEIETQPQHHLFLRIHQSYLVNYQHITTSGFDHVQMTNQTTLPISSKYRKSVRDRMLTLYKSRR